ncbi:contractile injection system protein, VgrG/Pvc8 family, partial [Lysobacter sp. D1-1-M9]
MADEGLYFWFEHEAAPGDDTLGGHVLVIADHEQAFADGGIVRFHRSDVTERSDSIQQWSASRRMQTSRLQRASWDYRSRGLRPAAAEALAGDAPVTEDIDTSGPYGWPDR